MEAFWDWLCSQIVPGSLLTSAILGTWAQIVTRARHRERMAVMRAQTIAIRQQTVALQAKADAE